MSAVIAGAGGSTGSALMRLCASRGLTVHGARRRPPPGSPAAACDFRDEADVERFIAAADAEAPIEIAVHNIGANVKFSLEETTSRVYRKSWELAALSAFHFASAVAPRMAARGRGTIIFTGATASLRGGAGFSAFSGAMSAKRMLAQSLARELGPQGVHVAHVVVDGPIDTPFVRGVIGDAEFEARRDNGGLLEPDAIAQAYWALHKQPRAAWTHEMDLRPYCEQF